MADRNALARATEQSSSPTPGYLYNDIAKQAATSPSISSEILSYLIRRLAKNNPHVKYKTLKTIAMVCQNANSRGVFKRTVIQDMQAIKEIKDCLNYRGKPDAVHGDELFERVRSQAKETLDVVYSDDPSSNHPMSLSGVGQGSGSYATGGGGGGYGGMSSAAGSGGYGTAPGVSGQVQGMRKMEGIGNPMFKDPRLDTGHVKSLGEMTIGDVAAAAVEGFKGIVKDPLARNIPGLGSSNVSHRPGNMGGGYGGPTMNSWSSAPPGQAQLASATNGQWTMASNRGPSAISSETYRGGMNNVPSGVGGSWGASSQSSSVAPGSSTSHSVYYNRSPVVNISGHPGEANTSGTFEKNLIMELCPPGGMKPEPPADKLANFSQSLPDLNSDLVCPALLDMLEEGQPWIIRAKVLCVMEKCIEVGEEMAKTSGNNVYADFFHMCREEITPLAGHTRVAVREPAKRVCKLLGLDVPAEAVASSAGPNANVARPSPYTVQQPVDGGPNLLDFDEPSPVPASAPVPTSLPPVPTEEPPAPPSQAPPPPPSSQPPTSLPATTSQSGGSLFGGMTVKGAPTTVTVAADVKPVKPQTLVSPSSVDADLLGDVHDSNHTSNPSSANDAKPESSELLDDMVAKPSSEMNVESQNTAASGFSFLNGGNESSMKAETSKTVDTTKSAFDPLLNGEKSVAMPMKQQQQQHPMVMTPQMAMIMQQQQQQIMMMQAQMQKMQMSNPGQPYFMMQQRQGSNSSLMGNPSVMGAMGGHGVATSFAFMEDPTKAKREASNKKFDFVQDAMKSAK